MSKLYENAAKALEGVVSDGQMIAVGGFGLCGIRFPRYAIPAKRT